MAKSVRYQGNLYIWEPSVAYRLEVEKVLKRMLTTQAGRTLLKYINAKPTWMLIQPFRPTKADPVNAYAQERSVADAAPAGYVADTVTFTIPVIGGKIELPSVVGTGKGSRVDVYYHPASWYEMNKRVGHIPPGGGPAEILFHEMIHGYREMSGLLRYRDKVDGEVRMDSVEEFYAIFAANVYRSERGFTKLRADHWGYKAVDDMMSYQGVYYEHYKQYIDRWFNEQKTFCLDMARAPAKFNPFREAAVELGLMTGPATSMRL
jgi:hypothetical protein